MKKIFILFSLISFLFGQFDEKMLSENLKTCLSGKYPSLCKEELLTAKQKNMVERASDNYIKINKHQKSSAGTLSKIHNPTIGFTMDMGGGDKMNLSTGEYIMDMGGGDKMNLSTGEYIMDMGFD